MDPHLDTFVNSILNSPDDISDSYAHPMIIRYFQRHQLHRPTNTGDTNAVVPDSTNRPGYMGSMVVVVIGVVVTVDKIPSPSVVYEVISIIVNSV